MYNGIGLQTARGSGTNGYVQTNKFFVRPKHSKNMDSSKGFGPDQGTAGIARKPNRDILEHDRKRQIELKLTILEDKLSDQGYTDAEIVDKLNEARASLEAADSAASGDGVNPIFANEKNVSDTQTHQIAARKEKQLETMRAALGILLPEEKEEKRQGLADLDVHEDDYEKSRNYKKGGLENDAEYEEGEISNRNEDGEAIAGRQKEDLESERKFGNKGHKSVRNSKDEGDYKHKKGRSRKHTDKATKRAYSSTDTESDVMHSTDSEHDSAIDIKEKKRAQRKSKKSKSSGRDNSNSDSDDSGDAHGRRGKGRHIHKHKKHEERKTRGGKKQQFSESSDSDAERKKARETDSDAETRRKHRYERSKKMIPEKVRDVSDHSSDGSEEKHQKGRSSKLVKSHKRHDSDESDLDIKTKHVSEKSKKMKSKVNNDSDQRSDDSDRDHERWGAKKFEKVHKRHTSERDADAEIKAKYRPEKTEKSKPAIIDASDHSSDDSDRDQQRWGSKKFEKGHKSADAEIKAKYRPEKIEKSKPAIIDASDHSSDDSDRDQQRWGSKKFEKGHKRHTLERDADAEIKAKYRPERSEKSKPAIIDASDNSCDDSGRERQRKGSDKLVKAPKIHDSDYDSDIKRKGRYEKPIRTNSKMNSDSDLDGGEMERGYRQRRKAGEFDKAHESRDMASDYDKNERSPLYKMQEVNRHVKRGRHDSDGEESDRKSKRSETVRYDDKEHKDDMRGRNRDDEYKRKHVEINEPSKDRVVHEHENRRHRQDEKERGNKDDISRGLRRDEEDGNGKRGRREEDEHGRRHDLDRDSSKRRRNEDSGWTDRRHRDRAHHSEDRWR